MLQVREMDPPPRTGMGLDEPTHFVPGLTLWDLYRDLARQTGTFLGLTVS